MSLNRLIRLAKQTGDRLIVHDPIDGNDVVVMNIDQYEMLLHAAAAYDVDDTFDGFTPDVSELSSEELLDDINRKIGIWRANQEAEAVVDRSEELAGEVADVDAFAQGGAMHSPWHSASEVIASEFDIPEEAPTPTPSVEEQAIRIEPITPAVEAQPVQTWEEEPLPESDEPVFYEEPV